MGEVTQEIVHSPQRRVCGDDDAKDEQIRSLREEVEQLEQARRLAVRAADQAKRDAEGHIQHLEQELEDLGREKAALQSRASSAEQELERCCYELQRAEARREDRSSEKAAVARARELQLAAERNA